MTCVVLMAGGLLWAAISMAVLKRTGSALPKRDDEAAAAGVSSDPLQTGFQG